MLLRLDDFDYPLPNELIAHLPCTKRDESQLMIVDKGLGSSCIKGFKDIASYMKSGDLLVLNDTKVFPARLFGKKNTGGKVELLLTDRIDGKLFRSLAKSSKPLKNGQNINFDDDFCGEVTKVLTGGRIEVKLMQSGSKAGRDIFSILDEIGEVPLPPYIKRVDDAPDALDKERYQTVYAKNVGAVAAPTAGLHFTGGLLDELVGRGVKVAKLTLHVGPGTFLPVLVDKIADHKMHEESFSIDDDCIEKISETKRSGGKVTAVGTTSVRTLETVFDENLKPRMKTGRSDLFIYPGYKFKVVDAMLTNFHLPKSTLFMLVCAFGGIDLMKRAYRVAVDKKMRFFSYGDAMYIK